MAKLSDEEIRVVLIGRDYTPQVIEPKIEIIEKPIRELRIKVVLAEPAGSGLRERLTS